MDVEFLWIFETYDIMEGINFVDWRTLKYMLEVLNLLFAKIDK